jgi:methyl-accepting chemotaxis protein
MARRKMAASDSPPKTWTATLEEAIAHLDSLNHSTERDFLKIGENLSEFIRTVDLISSELSALADLISGEHGSRASEALTSALERSREMRARAEDGVGLLGGMRQQAGKLKETLSGFKDTVSTFHIIGVLTRIETAHLGNAGADFGNLAGDVKALAGNIQAKIEGALDKAAQLTAPIESVLRRVSALEEGEAQDLPRVIAGVLASLKSFRDMQDRTRDASVRLGARYGAISQAFNNLIVSIQFHDITRQQVEHVIQALRKLCSESAGAGGRRHGDRDTGAVLALQSMQLADAAAKFAASVASVGHNLDQIAAHIQEMAGESRTLSGLSEDAKNSFFLEMERGCSTILAGLGECNDAEIAAEAASGGLAETMGQMQGSLEEIRTIEIQMQWMALNASVRADHIGAPGDALAVLAASMQTLALESGQRSQSLVEALGSMREATTRLSGSGGPALVSGPGGGLEEMRTAATDLHTSSERSFARMAEIAARTARLREDISAARDSFSVGALFAEGIGRARGMLQEVGEGNRSGLSRDGADGWQRGLADFTKHYTMQAERDVHQGITGVVAGVAPAAAPAEPPEVPSGEAGEMGENVEFF